MYKRQRNGNHESNPKSWCVSCKKAWTCSKCGCGPCYLSKPPTGPVCYKCGVGEGVDAQNPLDVFFEQNSLEYAFIQQEDEELINWFDKSCSAFEANCYDVKNTIGRSPTEEAVQYMRDTASTIVTITRQWVLSQIKKTTTRTTSKFILLRENAVSMWAMRDKKDFLYDHVRTE